MTVLSLEALAYDHPGGVAALVDVDLVVRRGRRLAVLGPNGAGKTTLLLHLNGTLAPKHGRILLDGREPGRDRRGLTDWRRRVGLVLQDADDQLFAPSVFEDVSFGPVNLGLPEPEIRTRVTAALDALGIADLADRPTHRLSFGQKKRVAIAGVLALSPEVLVLDEPSAGLDARAARRLFAALDTLAAEGRTLVYTTHDADLALAHADDVALFAAGRLIAAGPAGAILTDAETMDRAGLDPARG